MEFSAGFLDAQEALAGALQGAHRPAVSRCSKRWWQTVRRNDVVSTRSKKMSDKQLFDGLSDEQQPS